MNYSKNSRFAGILAAFMMLVLAGCAQNKVKSGAYSNVAQDLIIQAKSYHTAGEYQKEAALYEKVLPIYSNEEVMLAYADSLRLSGNINGALEVYNKILNNSSNIDAMEGKSLCLITQGNFDEATILINKILDKDAARWRVVNSLGVISALKGNNRQAEEYFKSALQLSEDNPVVLNNMGLALAFRGNYRDAAEKMSLAASKFPPQGANREKADMNLSLIYGVAGNAQKSKEIMDRYLSAQAVNNNLGFYARLSHDSMEAREYFRRALSQNPSSPSHKKAAENLKLLNQETGGPAPVLRQNTDEENVPASMKNKFKKKKS